MEKDPVEFRKLVATKILKWKELKSGCFWDEEQKLPHMLVDSKIYKKRQSMFSSKDLPGDGFCWAPDLSPTDDYMVLDIVRNKKHTEQKEIFVKTLEKILGEQGLFSYKIGDFARAAVAIIEGER